MKSAKYAKKLAFGLGYEVLNKKGEFIESFTSRSELMRNYPNIEIKVDKPYRNFHLKVN